MLCTQKLRSRKDIWFIDILQSSERFARPYGDLEKRYKHQKFLIRIVDGLVGLAFLIATTLSFWYSTSSENWLKVLVLKLFS